MQQVNVSTLIDLVFTQFKTLCDSTLKCALVSATVVNTRRVINVCYCLSSVSNKNNFDQELLKILKKMNHLVPIRQKLWKDEEVKALIQSYKIHIDDFSNYNLKVKSVFKFSCDPKSNRIHLNFIVKGGRCMANYFRGTG